MASRLMSPIEEDKVNSTPISELRKNYKSLAKDYIKLVDHDVIICPKCGEPLQKAYFYPDESNKLGVTCFCKNCIKLLGADYNKKTDTFTDNKDKAKRALNILNRPYIDSLYNSCVETAKEKIGMKIKSCGWTAYVIQVFTNPSYKGLTWKDSQYGIDDEENVETKRITTVMINRWGAGFSDSDYITMEDHYKMLKRNNPNADSNQEIFIEDLCRTRLLMLRAMRGEGKSDDYTKYSKTYQETFKQAGLRTVAEKDDSADETLGVTLATISQYTPTQYYKDKTLFKDFDGFGEYFDRFVKRPLMNLIAGTSERDEEFSIPESSENN